HQVWLGGPDTDFRYWWVFPGAVLVATGLWVIPALSAHDDQTTNVPLWPGGFFLVFLVMFGPTFGISANSNSQVLDERMVNGMDWWVWMFASIICVGIFYAMALVLPRRQPTPSRLTLWVQSAAFMGATIGIIVAIVFTQSRGPFLGLGAGLFVFFMLLLLRAMHRAKITEQPGLLRNLRILLGTWVVLVAVAGAFLVTFNLSNAPFFNELRQVPYLGRLGTLLDTDGGTGRVRLLIWSGDEHAGGAVELITADPLRTLIGWGPESMFVAYNPVYPPSLATIESRGASPDRSHQALLDELVTKGFLGLLSYFFMLISFGMLAWRLITNVKNGTGRCSLLPVSAW
ncbi:MAG: hypothetical protein HC914_19320, partial [Chloroflexaceae bacterium]|nr:hypothetical protein [Chloroflexaceae bacterium]